MSPSPAQLMQNYLFSLFLQQTCGPGMAGLPPPNLAQLLIGQTGYNFPFLPPEQSSFMANSVPQAAAASPQTPQTGLTSNYSPVDPVSSTQPNVPINTHHNSLSPSDSSDQTPPTNHTPTDTKPAKREEEDEPPRREKPSPVTKLKIKK